MDKGILVTHGNGQCPLNKDWTVDSNRSHVMVQSWIWTWDSIKSNFKRIFSVNLYKKPTSNFKINSTSKIYSTPFIRTFAKWLLTFQEWLTNQRVSPNCCSTYRKGCRSLWHKCLFGMKRVVFIDLLLKRGLGLTAEEKVCVVCCARPIFSSRPQFSWSTKTE